MAPGALPIAAAPPPERADAARNRRLILAAAGALVAERGVEGLSMDAVARRACVGKGTLYRRFGGRAGLARALFEKSEVALQERLIRGGPPLGPGAPPRERLLAFGHTYLELLERQAPLLALAEMGDPLLRLAVGPYASYHLHIRVLLGQCAPEVDAEVLADALLAHLSAANFLHLRHGRAIALGRLQAAWDVLVAGCCDGRR